jgi:hypothetical protein
VRFVEALRYDPGGDWNVAVPVMELVREGPLESELRRRIATALRSVEGNAVADEMDTEVWLVTGTPVGLPKPRIEPSARILERATGRDLDLEATD